jgi:anhydro-N-acetylmuramic acid kinase
MRRPACRLAVGLISGTSMDGIDAALVELSGRREHPQVDLRGFQTTPYPPTLRRRLLEIAGGDPTTSGEISSLNFVLGELFAGAALAVCRKGRVSPRRLAVIGSHGQTIFHQGPGAHTGTIKLGSRASTLQIGEPSIIAERTQAPVVADFRPADMAAGGHGAPLVPIVDYLLFGRSKRGVVALNLGGIANITVIPASAWPRNVFGFDTGPGNMVIDALAAHFTSRRKTFDLDGRRARRGSLRKTLLDRMLKLPFFRQWPPKSAGREQFGSEFLSRHFLREKSARPEDLLRTATELTALSVVSALHRFVLPQVQVDRVIVSGGGAHNQFLLERLGCLLPGIAIVSSETYGIPVDAKEAVAFALLADRTMRSLPGNLPSVTGARRPVVLGKLVRL